MQAGSMFVFLGCLLNYIPLFRSFSTYPRVGMILNPWNEGTCITSLAITADEPFVFVFRCYQPTSYRLQRLIAQKVSS